jgi:Leucine rich repeat
VFGRVLLSVALLASLLLSSPPPPAQAAEPELGTATIDSDVTTDRVGLVDPATGIWFLRGRNGTVGSFFYGNPADFPFVGDWNCDGIDTPGLYRQSDGFAYLRNSNTQGIANIRFFFGNPGDIPLAGDFDGDGCDTLSIYRSSEQRFYIINELGANDGGLGAADFSFLFGNPGDKPFVGDFNGDGVDTVGLHRESTGFVYFRNSLTTGIADNQFFFGDPGDRFVSGDWGTVDGTDTPGLFRPSNSTFFFRFSNTQGVANESLGWGVPSYLPIAGNWGTVTAGGPGTPPGGPGPGGPGGPGTPVPLSIGGSLPNGVVDVTYSAQLAISGGVPPYTVTKLSGPVWANVSTTGLVTGTPLAGNLGSTHLQVRVRDSKGTQATAAIVLTVVNKCQGVTAVPALQCQALAALYEQAGGNGWTDRTGWFTNLNPCNGWAGVACVGSNISLIRLKENNLVGTLPVEMANLTGLQNLDISENPGLSGAIPIGLFGITTLRTVILAHNALSGPIPAFTVPLPGLTRLSLDSNFLGEDIPTSMNGTNLPAIVELALDENGLTGDIPVEFFTMHTLTSLRLDQNQLTGQANGFEGTANFPSLTRLELGNNAFDSQPINGAELGTLTGLTVLDLAGNQFTGPVPNEFSNLHALTRLELNDNDLSGAIPAGFNAASFPNMAATPGGVTLNGQTGCLTATGAELTFVAAQDPLWNDGCP